MPDARRRNALASTMTRFWRSLPPFWRGLGCFVLGWSACVAFQFFLGMIPVNDAAYAAAIGWIPVIVLGAVEWLDQPSRAR